MSVLLRLIRSQRIKNKLCFLTQKDIKICNTTRRNNSSVQKIEKEEPYTPPKTWVSYGFDYEDIRVDRQLMHCTLFTTISLCLVIGVVGLGYLPDTRLRNWAQREAFLQLRYREEHGLPLIDPNLIDPSKIKLPSEEELAYTEIII